MYDIAVIGLGPAGVFFVNQLSHDYRVIAIDKKMPGGGSPIGLKSAFMKPCGGLLAPDAQKSLSRFNMTLPKSVLVSPQIFSVRVIDIKAMRLRYYQRFYINLDRHKFDSWLIEQIPKHIETHTNAACTAVAKSRDHYEITYYENNEAKTIKAKYVVGADGASSIVRRCLYKDFKIQRYLSIQQWFKNMHETPFYSCVFDSSLTDSYIWGITKDEYFILGGAFNIKTAKHDFELIKQKLQAHGFLFGRPIKTEACLVLRPRGIRNYCTGSDGAFLVGEAAGFISPSSLEGISYAIDSGYMLSKCLNDFPSDPNSRYRKATLKIRLKLYLKTFKRPFMYNGFLRACVMKSGFSSIDVY